MITLSEMINYVKLIWKFIKDDVLEGRMFSIKTAQKDFDADADATSQKTGITSITDSLGARQR